MALLTLGHGKKYALLNGKYLLFIEKLDGVGPVDNRPSIN